MLDHGMTTVTGTRRYIRVNVSCATSRDHAWLARLIFTLFFPLGQRDLIALYAGALGDNAVERYAEFLVSLALTADFNECRTVLTRGSEHGLNVERVAVVTVEKTTEKSFRV